MKSLPTLLFYFSYTLAGLSQNSIRIFENHSDVGNPKKAGDVQYDAASQSYTLSGGGYNIWFGRDEFQFLYSKIKGDFILNANFEFIGKGIDPHRKVGWMVRGSLDENASHISATAHGDGLTVLQWRELPGAFMRDPEDEIFFPKKNLKILQLERKGNTFTMKVANVGEPLQLVGSHELKLPEEVFAGLFICSHNADAVEQAKVWNVRIYKTVADNYNGYQQPALSSTLEVINVLDGTRKIIHEYEKRFEAPNWTRDGKNLIFNQEGALYKIPVQGGTPEKINTDPANRNNNDHGISFDGKWLAISSHRDGLPGGGSSIYIVPQQGGTPKLITEKTPSYWHGWNPNGKDLIYTAQRDGVFDIYKIGINGGAETKLTNGKANEISDGPEYSPDGKYIYYNASTTGTMQLCRMKTDGSSPEQLTFDEYNNWFPHISPDGKWIVFISFPVDINPTDHPFYKRVMLRLMSVNGGAPKVIAYLYGGQGTMNVPSWSPDSKFVAFVSNSK